MASWAARGWREVTRVAPSLTIPALVVAISSMVSPSQVLWSRPMGVMTSTWERTTLVASHCPPMPTSTTATSTG